MIVTTGGRGCSVSSASTSASVLDVDVGFADALDVVAELGDQQLGGVLVDRLGDGDDHAHLEQRLDQVGAALGHAVGELLDGDRLGHDDVADLLGRRAGLLVGALFLLAGAAQRGERAGAGIALVVERAGDGELAGLAAIARRGRGSGGPARDAWARRRGGTGVKRAGRRSSSLGGGGAAAAGSGGCGAAASASAALRRFFAATRAALAPLPRRGDCPRRGASRPRSRPAACAILAAARFLERGQARFLGLAQQAGLQLAAGGGIVGDRARRGLRRGAAGSGGARGAARAAAAAASRLRRFGLARAAEDAALLHLDHDRVRAAMAEALLHLAGLDRALEAQRRARSQLRLVSRIAHSCPS